ncbi:exocyst complex component 7-like isoform X2 [Osmerus eperlanus]
MENDNTSYRIETLDENIEKMEERLSFITSNLERSDRLTRSMVSTLTSLDNHFEHLENVVSPMHNYTTCQMQLKDTVNQTLFHMDKAISHHQVLRKTDKILLMGPAGRVHDYLDCLQQIKEAIKLFEGHTEELHLTTLKERLEKARPLMESEFCVLVDRHCTTAKTLDFLNLLGVERAGGETGDVIPKTGLENLKSIYTWLAEYTAQNSGHVATKLQTLSLDRNIKHELIGPAASGSRSKMSLKTFCNLKSLFRAKHPTLPSVPSMDVVGAPKYRSSSESLSEGKPPNPDSDVPPPLTLSISSPTPSHVTFKTPSKNTSPSKIKGGTLAGSRAYEASCPMNRLKTMSLGRNPLIKATRSQEPFNLMSYYAAKRSICLDYLLNVWKDRYRKCSVSSLNHHSLEKQNKHIIESPFKKTKKTDRESVLNMEIDVHLECVRVFVILVKREHTMLTQVFSEVCPRTFSALIQNALDNLLHDGENIIFATKRAFFRSEYSVILAILATVDYLIQQRNGPSVLEDASDSITAKVNTFISSMKELVTKGLDGFADSVKSHLDCKNLPMDGTVHKLNHNTILFLQQLIVNAGNKVNAALVLPNHDKGLGTAIKVTSSAHKLEKSSACLEQISAEEKEHLCRFSSYICRVLENLRQSLRNKAKAYDDPALSAIFLLNNFHYILNSLKRSKLIVVMKACGSDPEAEYRELIDEQKLLYQLS